MKNTRTRRTLMSAAVALVAATGITAASAATLGGITTDDLGAEDSIVVGCDDDGVEVSYATTYTAAEKRYEVTGVTVSDIASACVGQTLEVTVADDDGVSLGSGSLTVAGTSESVTFGSPVDARDVEHVAVLIAG